jgi:hypothetical protein
MSRVLKCVFGEIHYSFKVKKKPYRLLCTGRGERKASCSSHLTTENQFHIWKLQGAERQKYAYRIAKNKSQEVKGEFIFSLCLNVWATSQVVKQYFYRPNEKS